MPRILLLSDIHANLAALDAVMHDAEARYPLESVWSLGDAIGYGPSPSECLLRLESADAVAVLGNHELAALGRISLEDFNPFARSAAAVAPGASAAKQRSAARRSPRPRSVR